MPAKNMITLLVMRVIPMRLLRSEAESGVGRPDHRLCFFSRFLLIPLLILSAQCLTVDESCAAAGEHKQVLILHSYHPGLPSTDEIMAGIQEVFSSSKQNIQQNVEYLDTMRHPDAEYFTHVLDAILHYKLEKRSFDLVLVSDNEAFNFALAHRDDLFAATPIVFCGVDKFSPSMIEGLKDVTGVAENPDYTTLLKQIFSLDARTRKIIVVGSTRDLTGELDHQMFQEAAADFSKRARFIYWNDLTLGALESRLPTLQPGHVVVINGLVPDDEGHLIPFQELMRSFREFCKVPMYSPWKLYLGQGIVGGSLLSSRQQGHMAAEMVLEILQGGQPDAIAVRYPPAENPVFDDQQLKKFDFSTNRLPNGYQLINQPLGFYRLTRQQAWLLFSILIGSLSVTLVLLSNTLKRKKAEASLRVSEQSYKQLSQQFQIILDGIPDGMTLISKDMKVIWSNQGAGNYFNKRLGSVPGEYCCKLLYNRTAICDNCPAIKAFSSGNNEEAMITTPDGQFLEVKAFPVMGSSGDVANVIMHASDITEKMRLREEAIQASRLASLGELAAGVAHEINNPTALILLNVDMVRRCCEDVAPILQDYFDRHGDFKLGGIDYSEMRFELPHLLSEMFDGANRIKRIVDDLKDFVRRDAPEDKELIDLNEVVKTSLRLIKSVVKNSTDCFEVVYGENLPKVRGNFQRIEQVVVNLILNACQALPAKDKGVRVSTAYDGETERNMLVVHDQGVGISARDLPHVTEPFFTTKREHGGTGLGLSVASRIVDDHEGSLEFYSMPEQWTTVNLYLPVHQGVNIHD